VDFVNPGYLTVAEVAAELEMTNDGVYKLIRRGKLEGVRRSERGLRVPQEALADYQRRLIKRPHTVSIELTGASNARADFEAATGVSAAEWQRRWKADEIEDTIDNMLLTIRSLVLLVAEARSGTADGP
jgi:excisionase family DNA binding protein